MSFFCGILVVCTVGLTDKLFPARSVSVILLTYVVIVSAELCLLLWGIRLCIVVRKAPSEFNESRFISWAIYNETLLSLFLNITM